MSVASPPTHLIEGYPLFRRGKVRDSYDLGSELLIVSTDRVSAFDVVLPNLIPDKGKILNQLSAFWFAMTSDIVPNHFIGTDVSDLPSLGEADREWVRNRSMIVRKAERIDIECIVRGYLAGSGRKEYESNRTLAGLPLLEGLRLSDPLPEPLFTPAIKNESGHDENISVERLRHLVGEELSGLLEATSMDLYERARSHARIQGNLILADTKLEFGFVDGELTLIDEIFTPDSSRYWDIGAYSPGSPQESFDKQFLRDWLESLDWDKRPPGPSVPDEVAIPMRKRYIEAFQRLTGQTPKVD